MTKLSDLHAAIKDMADHQAIQKKIFKILDENPRILLTPQRKQLFRDSQDRYGGALGYYKIYRGDPEEIFSEKTKNMQGQPFDMVYSGRFRKGLYQVVTSSAVYITSSAEHLEAMEANIGNVFLSTDFFGITPENMKKYVKPKIKEILLPWMVQYMKGLKIVT